jgi:serine/threonine-protein kinase
MNDHLIIASRYRVLRELGRGGMGVVYVVEHARTGDQLALKLLHGRAARDPQSIERFKREARASARIKSDHVVKVVDADVAPELENAPFLVMELLDGTDLAKLVEMRGRLPRAEVVDYLAQAARALDKSHALGIVHRDLKPENLFLHRREDGSGIVKVLDFGISKIVGVEAGGEMTGAGMTNTGAIMGTPLYMAPEQARGQVGLIAATTDVWAVGLIALHLLTGEIYWRANTVAELMVHILAEPMRPPTQRWPWLPPGIDAWFLQSCAREPTQRFASIGQQVEALRATLGAAPAGAGLASVAAPTVTLPALPPSLSLGPTMGATASPTESSLVGAGTTNHPHALGATGVGAPAPSRGRALAVILPIAASLAVAAAGGVAWLSRDRSGTHEALSVSAVQGPADSAPSAPVPALLPPAVSPGTASEPGVVSSDPPLPSAAPATSGPGSPASPIRSARPLAYPAAAPLPQARTSAPTARPTFAPVSP